MYSCRNSCGPTVTSQCFAIWSEERPGALWPDVRADSAPLVSRGTTSRAHRAQTRRWAVAPLAAEAPPGAARAAPNFAATAGGRKMLPESEVGAGGGTWWIGGERVPWWPIG